MDISARDVLLAGEADDTSFVHVQWQRYLSGRLRAARVNPRGNCAGVRRAPPVKFTSELGDIQFRIDDIGFENLS